MSITINPILQDRLKKSDGTNFYRVCITYRRKRHYIKTNICIEPEDCTRSGKVKNTAKLDLIDDLVRRMRLAAASIDDYDLLTMDLKDVVEAIESKMSKPEAFRLDFVEFGRQIADMMSPGTAAVYRTSLNALVRFFKGRNPDIREITVRNLHKFEEFIRNEKVIKVNWRTGESKEINKSKGARAPSQYMAAIRHIYNTARLQFNDPDLGLLRLPVNPFEYYSVPRIPAAKHRDIPVETIQLMIDTRSELEGRVRMAVDAFLISFGLMGLNAVDLYKCDKPKNGILHYCRTKTATRRDDSAEMHVRVEECIGLIMKDYRGADRCFNYSCRYSNEGTFTTALNQGLNIWCTRYKQQRFTFYSARHSWATIGRGKRCNIDKGLITAGLCHVSESKTTDDVYIRQDWEQLWDANAKILSVFQWR